MSTPFSYGYGGSHCTCLACQGFVPLRSWPAPNARGMDGFDGAAEAQLPGDLAGAQMPGPGLVAGTVTGYRWWLLQLPDFSWSPQYADQRWPRRPLHGQVSPWEPGIQQAVCRSAYGPWHQDRPVPYIECGCGFYGYWSLTSHDLGGSPGAMKVAGVIRASGRTLIGDLGFRTEKARILALCPMVDRIAPFMPGRNGWSSALDPATAAMISAAEEIRLEAWAAMVSDRLEQTYPGVRVFETAGAMQAVFPPDENYELRPKPGPPWTWPLS